MARSKKKKRRSTGCTRKKISIKTRKGLVTFVGRQGPDCGPRPKPKTGHLRPWKNAMKDAGPQCARVSKNIRAYRKCVGQAIKSIHG